MFSLKNILILSCSGMFRDVPECCGMFHVPGFIDGPLGNAHRDIPVTRAVDKTRNMEHSGTFRNIPEHPGT